MKKICVVTATRAEYGLLRNVIRRIQEDEELELCLIVTGTHLLNEYGNTIDEIIEDGFEIKEKIPILRSDVQGTDMMIQAMAVAIEKFHEAFKHHKPDMLIVLGDRYELLSICEAALINKILIAHISGGEITEGAIDDTIRHCITKMSSLHFPGCETYRKRIIQMGEQPSTVFNYGDVGVENIYKMQYMERNQLEKDIGVSLDGEYACVTYHPTTLDDDIPENQIKEVLTAIEGFSNMNFIFTGANADAGGQTINECIQEYVLKHENCRYYASLGARRYSSLLKDSSMIIGNSSSGIIEAPCFGIPTVNIGIRQKGRLQSDGIINCGVNAEEIKKAIQYARSEQGKERAKKAVNPYGKGDTSAGIVKEIKNYLKTQGNTRKKFYDIPGWNTIGE